MSVVLDMKASHASWLGAAGLRTFDDFMQVAGGIPTSKHRHRETLPVDIECDGRARRFFLKRVFRVPAAHALQPMLRGRRGFSQPAIEWGVCNALEAAGIPAMTAVAYGERRRLGVPCQAFLLVEAAPMPHTLENWLVPGFPRPEVLDAPRRNALLHDLGRLVSDLNGAGFHWPDIGAKHIYAAQRDAPSDDRAWDFCLIDVERMTRLHDRGDDCKRLRKSVRKLLRSMRPAQFDEQGALYFEAGLTGRDGASPTHADRDTFRFLTDIAGERPRLPDDYEHPRCVPLIKSGRMFVDQRAMPWLQSLGIAGFRDVFDPLAGQSLDKPGLASHRDRIRLEATSAAGETKTFYLKRYHRPPLIEQLRRIADCGFKSSSAWREMHFIKRLSLLGIPTMEGVAFGQKMKGILEVRSFGITAGLSGTSLETLVARVREGSATAPRPADRHEIIRQLGLLVAHLHAARLYHRDLYLCHIFLTPRADGEIVLRLIDLARMIEKPMRPRRWAVKDLAAMAYSAPVGGVTRVDRLRFLYHYCRGKGGPARDERCRREIRGLAADIERRVARMARHDNHRAKRHSAEERA